MATLKSKAKVEKDESEELMKEAVTQGINLADDEESTVYTMLAGYKDSDGVTHKEFTLREITGKDEEAIHKSDVKNNGSKIVSTLSILIILARHGSIFTTLIQMSSTRLPKSRKWIVLFQYVSTFYSSHNT